MNQQPTIAINNVMVGTDFSATAHIALSYAATIAARYNSRLSVAHVINVEPFDSPESESGRTALNQARDEACRKIRQSLATLRLTHPSSDIVVVADDVAGGLREIIEKHHIDLTVLGTHGRRTLDKLLLGSVTEEVFRMAPCPVLTVAPDTSPFSNERQIRNMLYLVEFVPDKSKAAAYAISLAEQYGAILAVMNVRENLAPTAAAIEWFEPEMEHWIQQHLPANSDLRNRVRFHIGFGAPADAILKFAAKANVGLIVMSVSPRDPFMTAHLPISDTAYEVVSRATCPVLTIR